MMETAAPPHMQQLWGHPKGLVVIFGVEMWERFSYYGMRSLLVLFLRNDLLLPGGGMGEGGGLVGSGVVRALMGGGAIVTGGEAQQAASTIYGMYTGAVYLTPLAGGYIADRWLGKRACVIIGLALMALGHFLLALKSMFFVGLGTIAIGSGFFKPNLNVQLGALYPTGDLRRDRAYSIFYMGINVGASGSLATTASSQVQSQHPEPQPDSHTAAITQQSQRYWQP
jgi:POT family proton-dependent oligopeptide transporter